MKTISEHQLSFLHAITLYGETYPSHTGGILHLYDENDLDKIINILDKTILEQDIIHYKFKKVGDTFNTYLDTKTKVIDQFDFRNGWDQAVITKYFEERLDYSKKLYKLAVIRQKEHIAILLVLHHVISDSMSIHLCASMVLDYLSSKHIKKLDTYDMYLDREKSYLASSQFSKDELYWKNILSEAKSTVSKPMWHIPKIGPIKQHVYELSTIETQKLDDFIKNYGGSPQILFELAVAAELAHANDQLLITLGTTTHNRKKTENASIGMYIATLPLILNLKLKKSILENYRDIITKHYGMYRHQMYPYRHILKHSKDYAHTNLFDTMVIFHKPYEKSYDMKYQLETLSHQTSMLSVLINIEKRSPKNRYVLSFDFKTEVFETEVERDNYVKRILKRLDSIISNPNNLLEVLIYPTDTHAVTIKRGNLTILDIFNQVVAQNTHHIAAKHKHESITYDGLNKLSNQIAAKLTGSTKIKSIIQIDVTNPLYAVSTILGVIKANLSYTFLPKDLNRDLLETYQKIAGVNFVVDDVFFKNIETYDFSPMRRTNDILGIYFTSGTTNIPKAVPVTDLGILNYCMQEKGYQNDVKNISTLLNLSPFNFDISLENIFLSLLYGKTLILGNLEDVGDTYLTSHDFLSTTPSILQFLCQYEPIILRSMKVIVSGGEVLGLSVIKNIRSLTEATIYNSYGPTECSVAVTYQKIDNDYVTLGKPFTGCYIKIKSPSFYDLYDGYIGQIVVSGVCVSPGYMNLTKTNTFIKEQLGYSYFTGDYGYINHKGDLVYIGRLDHQIKRNGVRIDLEQIDYVLLNHPEVIQSQSIYKDDDIYTYVISKTLDYDTVYGHLNAHLPSIYLPNHIILSQEIMMNPQGKTSLVKNISTIKHIFQPKNDLESIYLEKIKKVFKIKTLYESDTFTDLGGDSLDILALMIELDEVNIELPLKAVYEAPNIVSLIKNINTVIAKDHPITYYDFSNKNLKKPLLHILLLGSTGFLGAHILYELQKNKDLKVTVLVRHQKAKTGKNHFKNVLTYYFDNKIDLSRLNIITTDITKPFFGLEKTLYETLIKTVDAVINAAAKVDYVGKRSEYMGINVDLVSNIIEFTGNRSIPIFHISTIGLLFGEKTSVREDQVLNQSTYSNYYLETKKAAEDLLLHAKVTYNLPIYILRVGNLMPRYADLKFQIHKKRNAIYHLFNQKEKSIEKINKHFELDLTPVDHVARVIVNLMYQQPDDVIYHLHAPYIVSIDTKDKGINIKSHYEMILQEKTLNTLKACQIAFPRISKNYVKKVMKSWK